VQILLLVLISALSNDILGNYLVAEDCHYHNG